MRARRFRSRVLAAVTTALLGVGGLALLGGASADAATPVRVMPLGDSITGSPGCWRQLLWSRLQSGGYAGRVDFVGTLNNSTSCGTTYDGDNEGHGGFLATNILRDNQLPGWLSATRPDVVLMHLGTNDVWNGISTSSILSTFGGLVDQMRASNPSMRIVVAQILPMNPSGCSACAQRVVDLDAAIPAWAAGKSTAASPITVVDQWTGFSTATDTSDGVHPNASGNQKMSDRFYPVLTAAVDSVGTPPTTTTPPVTTPPVTTPPVTTSPPPTGRTCTATLSVPNAWGGGFIGTVRVTAGSTPISRWSVTLTVPSGGSVANLWNGQRTGTVVAAMSYNAALPAGGSTEFGFQANGSPTGWSVASCAAA